MTEIKLINEYKKLAKKYSNLPTFEDMEKDFEISHVEIKEETKQLLSLEIRRKIQEKIIYYCKLMEAMIFPSGSSPLEVYEVNSIPKELRDRISKIHKKFMDVERFCRVLDIQTSEKEDVEYIVLATERLNQYRADLLELAQKMRDAWSKDQKEEGEQYFG